MKRLLLALGLIGLLGGCGSKEPYLHTELLTPTCIKPLIGYRYETCCKIRFSINHQEFEIPKGFQTDLASIPRIVWPIMSPAHSSLIPAAIVHDWFYRKTCEFTRLQTDLIFYHMLRNDGVSTARASLMYYSVRTFGWNYYNEDYCDEETKGLDQETRELQAQALYRHSGQDDNRMES